MRIASQLVSLHVDGPCVLFFVFFLLFWGCHYIRIPMWVHYYILILVVEMSSHMFSLCGGCHYILFLYVRRQHKRILSGGVLLHIDSLCGHYIFFLHVRIVLQEDSLHGDGHSELLLSLRMSVHKDSICGCAIILCFSLWRRPLHIVPLCGDCHYILDLSCADAIT